MARSLVHSFVLTDVATGWTECIALIARDQAMIVDALKDWRRETVKRMLFGAEEILLESTEAAIVASAP